MHLSLYLSPLHSSSFPMHSLLFHPSLIPVPQL
uniref:Uncharacterized protein n=1 Tax=Arundo donax TaxID=35708 RepID=A0A0A9A9X0_ARUDO